MSNNAPDYKDNLFFHPKKTLSMPITKEYTKVLFLMFIKILFISWGVFVSLGMLYGLIVIFLRLYFWMDF
jgi:hypothetical protein